MKLRKIIFGEHGFRKLKNIEIDIAEGITAIAGHNSIGKSTILGLIANCSGLNSGENSFFGKKFQANFQDAFYLDYHQDFYQYTDNGTSRKSQMPKVVIQYEHQHHDENVIIEKVCAVSTQKYSIKKDSYKKHMVKVEKPIEPNHTLDFSEDTAVDSERIDIWRMRIIPRTNDSILNDELKLIYKGAAKIPIPTIYLGMSRMTPIGEFEIELIDKTAKRIDEESSKFIFDSFNSVLPLKGKNSIVTSHTFKGSKKSSYLPDFNHDSFSISLGQDSLSSIITALASFEYLKRKDPNYHGGILVIDEVDAGLHPRAQEKLIELLHKQAKKLNLQIILTTHSLTVIKTLFLKNDHAGKKVNNIVYLQDSNYPRVMQDATYTKIKNDMLVLPHKDHKEHSLTVKLYFEDDEALFFFQKILKYLNITNNKHEFGVNLNPISLKVGCSILMALHEADKYFQNIVLIPDNDVFTQERNREKIESCPLICPLPGNSSFSPSTSGTDRTPEAILYDFLKRKSADGDYTFWQSMPGTYTSDYVTERVLTLTTALNREKYKEWFNSNQDFLEESEIVEKWCSENEQEIEKFISRLRIAIDKSSKVSGQT